MRSIVHRLLKIDFDCLNPDLFKAIESLESNYYKLKNENADLDEQYEDLRYESKNLKIELDKLKTDDQKSLTDISKKLSNALKNEGEKEMIEIFVLNRAKILDHFTMAYVAELNLKPSQVKLVQGVGEDGFVEMFFEKHSNLILPNSAK